MKRQSTSNSIKKPYETDAKSFKALYDFIAMLNESLNTHVLIK